MIARNGDAGPAMPRAARSGGRRSQAVVLLCGLIVIAAFWAGLFYHLGQRRGLVLDQTQRDVTNLSVAIAEQVSRLVEGTDQVMRLIQSDHDTDPDSFDFAAWIKRATFLDGVALQIAIFDASGDLTNSRIPLKPGMPAVNVGDRSYFRHLAEHADAGLFVERTLRGRIQNRWALQLARRLTRPDGTFAGVLVISLDPDFLARHFGALDVGANGSITLIGRDGFVRARAPFATGMYDLDVSAQPHGREMFRLLARAPVGSYQGQSALDGTSRVFGYRAVGALPLVVTVGKSIDESLGAYHVEKRRVLSVGAGITLVLLAALLSLLMELDRRRKREAQLVEAHEAIGVSESRYRLLADHSTDMIVQLDKNGRRLFVSPASRQLFGYAPEEFVGTRPQDFVHPDDKHELDETVAALASGASDSLVSTHRFRHRDGRWVRVEASWQAVRDASGAVTGLLASVRNVMARHMAETALRESESRYRTLADTLPQLVWITDAATGEAVYVNRQFDLYCGPIGRSREAWIDLIHPDDRVEMEAALAAAAESGATWEVQRRLRRHDGSYRWHKLVTIPLRRGGAVTRWLATALDVDDIITARRALDETTDLLRLAQDAAGTGSWDFDLVARIVVLSPESARLHGLAGDGPVSLPIERWAELLFSGDADATLRTVAEAVAARAKLETEFRITAPDGEIRWLQGIGRTYYDARGEAVRMIGLNFDITKRKDAELQLLHAKTTAEAARIEAERASAAKSEFLASMSHEIRTPLHAIIGFTDILAGSDRLAPDLRRQAELARSSGAALLTIVNDILDFSEVEAGQVTLDRAAFAPAGLLDNCLSIIRGGASAKGLEIRSHVDRSLPRGLVGDEGRLRQVLLNLLNNAVKFTPSGSITVQLRHEGSSARGEQIRFSVTDTGLGIPKAKQHLLFERFSQVDGSIRRDFGGTGLGLAICKRLVDLMGGAIGVVSDKGQGATFWFSLTLPRGTVPAGLSAVAPAPQARKCGRLLLVEDVAINQELACAVLQAVGHQVDVVDDGAAAIKAVRTRDYDLVLMDVQMPGMDGVTASRLIRKLDGPAHAVPIIAMTANVLPEEIAEFRAAGMDDHVGKPFNRADLYAVIDRWLPGSEPVAAPPPPTGSIDCAVLDELVGLHTPSGVIRLLAYLEDELVRGLDGDAATPSARDELRREAHVLVSAAGMLGFATLSAACAELEALTEARIAGDGDSRFPVAVARVRDLAKATIVEIERLTQSLSQIPSAPLAAQA